MNSLRKSLSGVVAFLFALAMMLGAQTLHAQTTYSDNGSLLTTSPKFRRTGTGNPPTTLGGSASALYFYHLYEFDVTVATEGVWAFRSNSTTGGFDNFTILYQTTFNPASPLTNVVIAADDLSNSLGIAQNRYSGFNKALTAGHYIFVTTSFFDVTAGSTHEGAFANTITSPPPPAAKFNRPEAGVPPTTLSATATNVSYVIERTVTISAANAGYYRYVDDAVGFDNFTVVYDGAFNSASPLTNVIAANDDLGDTATSGFNSIRLRSGHTYTFVVTGKTNTDYGNQSATLTLLPGPIFNRPNEGMPPTTLSATGTAVPYKIFTNGGDTDTWTPTSAEAGLYKFTSISTDWDNFTVLYDGVFNPASPLTNAIIANDDLRGSRISGFTYNFIAGHTYTFVVTGYSNISYGVSTDTLERIQRTTLNGDLNGTSPLYNRTNEGTPPTAINTSEKVRYQVMRLIVTVPGTYEIVADSSVLPGMDSFLSVYSGTFNPLAPLTNVLAAADDYVYNDYARSGGMQINLEAGTYMLVAAGFNNAALGAYVMTVTGPASVGLSLLQETEVLKGNLTYSATQTMGAHLYTFTFRPTSGNGNDIIATANVAATVNGVAAYSVNSSNVIPGTNYNVLLSGGNVLKSLANVTIPQSGASTFNFTLLPGDINQDNSIDFGDLSTMLQVYNALFDDPLYSAASDLNGDGGIDFGDLSLMLQNYNAFGNEFP